MYVYWRQQQLTAVCYFERKHKQTGAGAGEIHMQTLMTAMYVYQVAAL